MNLSRFFVPVAALALLGLCPSAARSLDIPAFDLGNHAPMPAAVVQLYADLAAIPAGSTATDAQQQALVADVATLTVTDAQGVVCLSGDIAHGQRTSELKN